MRCTHILETSVVDFTALVSTVVWSGDDKACCRTLTIDLASIPEDETLPAHGITVGSRILFYDDDGTQLFDGFCFEYRLATDERLATITCYDRGVYLTRCQIYASVVDGTPEAFAQAMADQYGMAVADLATTGYTFSRAFLGTTLYKSIATAYTLASAITGDKYAMGYDLDKFYVRVKAVDSESLVIAGGSNLLSATTELSISDMVNQVVVIDDTGAVVSTVSDQDNVDAYGLLQSVINQADDSDAQAQALLDDNGVVQTITVTSMGDVRAITGKVVVVEEPYTGLTGQFWVASDAHTWSGGVYTNKLTLSFDCLMDEQDVGT